MAKYSKGAQKGVKSAVKRMKKGTLTSGRSGKKVKSRKQAIAIGLSEARKKGAKVPKKKAASKKAAPKKKIAKIPIAIGTTAKRSAPKKAAVATKKKTATRKKTAVAKKPASKVAAIKRIPVPTNQLVKKEDRPPASELSEEMSEKAVNGDHDQKSGLNVPDDDEVNRKIEDPIKAFDMHVAEKASVKRDPKGMRVSSVSKSRIKPSGKKPLWH
jgi:hypothetical protein